ncbi:hypothetical protein JOC36_000656 [Weissella uvarum]|uniref:hypothetical protein n=1 Tax=Weissella uvarum TaxID=1479233 RepID=UPI00202F5F00|nr:hypothetical protein [Weissella uvarum]MBM7617107.1 hypothetical protein [Weissella uvarum]
MTNRLYVHIGPEKQSVAPVVQFEFGEEYLDLLIVSQVADGLTLADFPDVADDLILRGIDEKGNLFPIYGYRVVDDQLILG